MQVGGAIGLAVLATLATERTSSLRADGESIDAALNGGYHLAYLIGAALVAVAIVVAATVLRAGSPAAASSTAPSARRHAEPAYSDARLSTIVACPIACTSRTPTRPTR